MSSVSSGVLAKVQAALPNQIGSNARWTEATVQNLILAADRAVRERCELSRASSEISLVDDTYEYEVPVNFISIDKVEFSLDGTNYDWIVNCRTMEDLDCINSKWRESRSQRPDFYTLLSAPGVRDNSDGNIPSKILIYPTLTTAGSATIKLTGVVTPASYAEYLTAYAADDVQMKCHVPYVLSILYAKEDPNKAMQYYDRFLMGCNSVVGRFRSQYKDNSVRR